MSENIPDIDNSNDGELAGVLTDYLRAWLRDEVDDMLPAVVVSYDHKANRAVLKPLVMIGTTSGAKVSRAEVSGVPVFRFGAGGLFMAFPVRAGDTGWIKANDRDISLILQRGAQEDWPNTKRLHDFSDSMFFPDAMKGWIIDESNHGAAVIQNMSGSVCISVHDDKISFKGPVEFENDVTHKSPVEFQNGGEFKGKGPTHDGVNLGKEHTHGGVSKGNENSGGVSS